jgi:hypothetical protein
MAEPPVGEDPSNISSSTSPETESTETTRSGHPLSSPATTVEVPTMQGLEKESETTGENYARESDKGGVRSPRKLDMNHLGLEDELCKLKEKLSEIEKQTERERWERERLEREVRLRDDNLRIPAFYSAKTAMPLLRRYRDGDEVDAHKRGMIRMFEWNLISSKERMRSFRNSEKIEIAYLRKRNNGNPSVSRWNES